MEGDLKDTRRNTQNAALNVDLFKISFIISKDSGCYFLSNSFVDI